MAKQRKGVGLTSFATGFAKGASQGIQMGMYRAMQQQKAGETENEKLASALTVFQRSVDKELDPELYAEITRDILFLNTGGASITPDMRKTMLEKHKGQMTGAVVAKPPEPEEIEEEYHTFKHTGTEDYVTPGRTYRPGERISVKKSDVEAGGLSDSPFQFVGKTSTATGVTSTVERKTAKDIDDRLRFVDTGDLVFPDVEPKAKQLASQRKFAEKEYARLVAMKRGDSSFQFINEQGEWETLPVKIAEWTPELQKALNFYTNQLREFGIVTSETPEPMPEDTDDLDDIIEDLLKQRRPAAMQSRMQSSSKPILYQKSGMMTPGAMRKSGRKPVG